MAIEREHPEQPDASAEYLHRRYSIGIPKELIQISPIGTPVGKESDRQAWGVAIIDEIGHQQEVQSYPVFFKAWHQWDLFSDEKWKEKKWFIHKPYLPPGFPRDALPTRNKLLAPPAFSPPVNARGIPVEIIARVVQSLSGEVTDDPQALVNEYQRVLQANAEQYDTLFETFDQNPHLRQLYFSCLRNVLNKV